LCSSTTAIFILSKQQYPKFQTISLYLHGIETDLRGTTIKIKGTNTSLNEYNHKTKKLSYIYISILFFLDLGNSTVHDLSSTEKRITLQKKHCTVVVGKRFKKKIFSPSLKEPDLASICSKFELPVETQITGKANIFHNSRLSDCGPKLVT